MLRRFFVTCLLAAVLCATIVSATQAHQPAVVLAHEQPQAFVVRIYYSTPAQLAALRRSIDVWAVYPDRGYADALVWPDQYLTLIAQGYRIEIDRERTDQLKRAGQRLPEQINGIPGYACYRTVEETYLTAQSIVTAHPTLAQWIDIGDSWEKVTAGGEPGYDLMVLKLTNQATPGPKPKFFAMSSVHAREYTPAELNTRFAEYLINHYGVDPDVTWLLDYHEVHLLLQANPDGRKKAEAGLSWRKNTNENYCGATSNSRGADLNRNYPFYWNFCDPGDGCSSGNACDTDYRGPSAASEPETQAVVNYVRSQYPDLRADDIGAAAPITTSGLFLDLHSYSQLVLWPWGFTATPAPNSTALQTLGRKFAYFNNYTPQQSIGLYPTDGTTDDFAYGELGVPAYTFELGTNFFQDCATFENTIVPNNLPALVYGLKALRRPYQNPAGPDTLNVSVTPTSTLTGSTITLTATANDTRYRSGAGEPTQNIAAARYSIDAPSWITGTITYPLNATDGAFNNPIEALQAGVNLSGLGTGRHLIFVESQDASGNWGPPTAVFVWIELAPDSAITGTIRAQDTANPLGGAHISATLGTTLTFHTTSLANGTYQLDVLAGIYDLHAGKYGYHGSTINAVQAQVGLTASQDITLTPAAFYTVTGAVSDRDTGQPLSATIQVDGYPDAPIQTNASTGYYSITLAEDIAYIFRVNAMGYLPLDRSVGPLTGDRMEDFALDVDRDACIAPGYTFNGLHEAFTTTGTPTGWSVVNNAGSAGWRFDDPKPRGNLTGGTGNFAIADSDYAGSVNMDTELRTPVLDFSALSAVTLTFKTDFYRYASEVADVDVSVNGASGPWTTVWHKSGASYRGPRTETLDLTAQAAGQANVMLRFRYHNANYEWWWQVDDVEIGRCMASVFSAPIFDPSAAAQSADPGATITYTLQLSNTDAVSHTFDILPGAHAWPINAPTSLGPVNAQSAAPLTITVSIPANALANSADIVTLTAQAQDNALLQAGATLTTSANLVRGVQLEPASAQQDGPINQAVGYTLTVSNTGNWTDTFSLNATLAHWPVQLLPLSVTLPAHSDTFANVIVSVPVTATVQLTDVVRITVTGTEVSDFSELITRAIYAYQVHLPLILK